MLLPPFNRCRSLPSRLKLKQSKDLEFHLDLYRQREDVNAVDYCHCPWATGYASAGLEITCLTAGTVENVGRIPVIPLSRNGGPQSADEIGLFFDDPAIKAAALGNHGTIGDCNTLMAAQYIVEIIEETAHIAFVRDTLLPSSGRTLPKLPRYGTHEHEQGALVRA